RFENLSRGTPGDDGLQLSSLAQASAEHRVVDEFADGDLADLDLVIAGFSYEAADADDVGAGVVRCAELGVLRAAHGDDVLHRAERLDVVDDRRAQVEAEHCGEIGRLDPGIRALPFQGLNETGLLAADVSAGATVNVDFQIVAGTQDVLSEEVLGSGFLQRAIEYLRALGKLATDIDVGEVDVIRVAGDDHTLEQLVRVFVEDLLVLERAGLRFVGV